MTEPILQVRCIPKPAQSTSSVVDRLKTARQRRVGWLGQSVGSRQPGRIQSRERTIFVTSRPTPKYESFQANKLAGHESSRFQVRVTAFLGRIAGNAFKGGGGIG
jgi:hypothetical protein